MGSRRPLIIQMLSFVQIFTKLLWHFQNAGYFELVCPPQQPCWAVVLERKEPRLQADYMGGRDYPRLCAALVGWWEGVGLGSADSGCPFPLGSADLISQENLH